METSIGKALNLSNDYIRGLVDGEGCFTFCSNKFFSKKQGKTIRKKVPTFVIAMHVRDKDLIRAICCKLRLTNAVYEFQPPSNDKYKRGRAVRLIVREYEQLRDIIIPFFYKKLKGNKGKQFQEWLDKIGTESEVSKKFKTLYQLYKNDYYDDPTKKWFWEEKEEQEIKNKYKHLFEIKEINSKENKSVFSLFFQK